MERDLSRITAMIQELHEIVDRSLKVNAGEEGPPESAEELYLRITRIALAASDAVRQAGMQADAAAEAAAEAQDHGASAAAAVLEQLTGLNVTVTPVGCFEAPYGAYDAQSGTLALYLPFCREGGQSGVFLSDETEGSRKASEGVGASEWALGQVGASARDALGEAERACEQAAGGVCAAERDTAPTGEGAGVNGAGGAHSGGSGASGASSGSSSTYFSVDNSAGGSGGSGGRNGTGYGGGGGGSGGNGSGAAPGAGGAASDGAAYGDNGTANPATHLYGGRGGDGAVLIEY